MVLMPRLDDEDDSAQPPDVEPTFNRGATMLLVSLVIHGSVDIALLDGKSHDEIRSDLHEEFAGRAAALPAHRAEWFLGFVDQQVEEALSKPRPAD